MPDWNLIAAFVLAALALCLVPGPDMLFVLTNSLARGARAGLLCSTGIALAMVVHTTAAILGLSLLFERSVWAFEVVRYAGAAYLLWLGVRALRGSGGGIGDDPGEVALPALAALRRGFLTNLLNPKVVVFFAAFFPQFVSPENGPVVPQFVFLGALFTALGFLADAAVALASGKARSVLLGKPGVGRLSERISGVVFVGLGVYLLFQERPSS